jgi:hypothetical protein
MVEVKKGRFQYSESFERPTNTDSITVYIFSYFLFKPALICIEILIFFTFNPYFVKKIRKSLHNGTEKRLEIGEISGKSGFGDKESP